MTSPKGPVVGAIRTFEDVKRALDNLRSYLVGLGDLKGDKGDPGTPVKPATSVVPETSFGKSSYAGTANTYSRGDHTHGSPTAPADPVPAHVAAGDPHTQYVKKADFSQVTATVALDTTKYLSLTIGGTTYKIGIVA